MIGGGPLGKEIGDRLVEQGVRLASVWGSCVLISLYAENIDDVF